jgi:integrase
VFIKTLLYTRVRVSELVAIRIDDVDLDACRIRITQGKGAKGRVVPFPESFKETLPLHIEALRAEGVRGLPLRVELEEGLHTPNPSQRGHGSRGRITRQRAPKFGLEGLRPSAFCE